MTNTTVTIIPDVTETTINTNDIISPTITSVIEGSTLTVTNVIEGTTSTIPGHIISDSFDFNPEDENWFLGATVGYDKQFDTLLLGAMLDLNASKYQTRYSNLASNTSLLTDLNWFSTARIRAGIAMRQWLLYGTLGAALGNFKVVATDRSGRWSARYTEPGWAGGAGLAYALSNTWVVDCSYLHLDFSSVSRVMGASRVQTNLSADVVKLGINYKF
ncbi:MAG: porin family protein [Legionellaceae bacterium]|nr:porin family protein [Legionellaceae bacterium]